ncbi:TIGR03905 family TSCPD domain-containing protein [Clostridium intestinale]|uniref:TIGR03905 family TSCPD domain-containing protein n=1 Tax=Clostridium intestinale TaxID=36845 RepID=UPI002DD6305D|nr:TIGR03905 family TSCPD domain-containing protein [Clostridium intestinale]WRY50369.1 TIGR03905 family TSCPD domain-containing protein [Clostridium intestinale]
MKYTTSGVCAREISFDVEDNKLKNVSYVAGCNGNLQALSALVEGLDIDTVISKLQGIDCKQKGTSCADQLAKALIEYKVKLDSDAV